MDKLIARRIEDARIRLATPGATRNPYPESWLDWRTAMSQLRAKAAARRAAAKN